MIDIDKTTLKEKVNAALDEIRPHLAVDGGNIEVVGIDDEMHVIIKWLGNCEHCSMSTMTMRAGVEHTIKSKFPEVKGVKALNGFYAS